MEKESVIPKGYSSTTCLPNRFLKDELCRQCGGSGEIPFKYGNTKCPLCRGVGRESNDLGKDIMVFLSLVYPGRI